MKSSSRTIQQNILSFHKHLIADPHHRFRSWEHCYRFFSQRPADVELASLHLGFYLASWGMYRGSSFLLQKDFQVHQPIVEEILKSDYDMIRAVTLNDLGSAHGPALMAKILELVGWIKQCYAETLGHGERRINVTDTLATKILLGTLGAVPAYDRYVKSGMRTCGLRFSKLTPKNFSALVDYCLTYRAEFLEAQRHISTYGLEYPDMKVIDMYFWTVGAREDGRNL